MNKIYNLVNEMRSSIGEFCIKDCKAKCCKMGKLPLYSQDEVKIISSALKTEFSFHIEQSAKGDYYFDLTNCMCPYLDEENKCMIHNKQRPTMCLMFPVFIKNNSVVLASDCAAFKKGLFQDFYSKIKDLNYIVLVE